MKLSTKVGQKVRRDRQIRKALSKGVQNTLVDGYNDFTICNVFFSHISRDDNSLTGSHRYKVFSNLPRLHAGRMYREDDGSWQGFNDDWFETGTCSSKEECIQKLINSQWLPEYYWSECYRRLPLETAEAYLERLGEDFSKESVEIFKVMRPEFK